MSDGFQFIDIIFFAMIAAFLVLRLRGVIGRRDGHEGSFRDAFKNQDKEQPDNNPDNNIVSFPDHKESPPEEDARDVDEFDAGEGDDDSMVQGLRLIIEADPKFKPEEFLSGAKIAFELIIGAFAAGDAGALKPMLNAEVFANFSQAIRDREQAGETLEDTLIGIKAAEIVEAYIEDRTSNITIKLVSEQINATRDEDGNVIDGDPNAVIDVTDFWTFSRGIKSRDPNWTLVATSSLD